MSIRYFCRIWGTSVCLIGASVVSLYSAASQGTAPTFQYTTQGASYILAGSEPARNDTTTIGTVLVPIRLSFTTEAGGKHVTMDAAPDVPAILRSPVFSKFSFPSADTQYADAILRATFPKPSAWHTLLGTPEVKPLTISVPPANGYVLTSKRSGASLAVVDVQFLQGEIFKQIPRQDSKLILALTHNTTYYALGDATVCCSWGTHGIDSVTGNSFVLASYIHNAPAIVTDRDIQPFTEQLAEFIYDPLHDPLFQGPEASAPGNRLARWMRPDINACAGSGVASRYFLLEPTDTNPKNNIPSSPAFVAKTTGAVYHLQNVALLPWYAATSGAYSFPAPRALTQPATPCPPRRQNVEGIAEPTVPAAPSSSSQNGHRLIGYWIAYGASPSGFPLRKISPQWDVIIVAFASPDHSAPEGTLQFQTPAGYDPTQFKADIANLKRQGKKVMISLGGGGQYFTLADPKSTANFVSSVTSIVAEYGFDGVDIDFETPSLALDPGDTDFKHPTTPSVVNLISGLRQLHDHFGPGFMISLVPEGPQMPAGFVTYGGQFGSYLSLAYGLRDILSFVDVQDYNTPPLEGLDGEIYQAGSIDYHAAMTELVLHGFHVAGNSQQFFPPVPADKIAVGLLIGDTTPAIVSQALSYIIAGKLPAGTTYKLRKPSGYSDMIGAMFWTINADRDNNYSFSNLIGPQLHSYPPAALQGHQR